MQAQADESREDLYFKIIDGEPHFVTVKSLGPNDGTYGQAIKAFEKLKITNGKIWGAYASKTEAEPHVKVAKRLKAHHATLAGA